MLILTRKEGESIVIGGIGGNCTVTVLAIHGRQVRIGIDAPLDVVIHRKEYAEKLQHEKADQSGGPPALGTMQKLRARFKGSARR